MHFAQPSADSANSALHTASTLGETSRRMVNALVQAFSLS